MICLQCRQKRFLPGRLGRRLESLWQRDRRIDISSFLSSLFAFSVGVWDAWMQLKAPRLGDVENISAYSISDPYSNEDMAI
jgi:hypothetical protein